VTEKEQFTAMLTRAGGHILTSGATWRILVGASHKNKIANSDR
jgi:hypothetical protein